MSTQPQPQASMPWVRLETGAYRCERHTVDFELPQTCKACEADKSPPIGSVEKRSLPRAPKGCRSSVQHEAWFTKIANDAIADATRLGKLAIEYATALPEPEPEPEPEGEVIFAAPDAEPKKKPKRRSKFDFHLEVNMAKHRDVAIKAARAASQLALAREDEDLVDQRERRLRTAAKKERTH